MLAGAHSCGNLAPDCRQVESNAAVCMQGKQAAAIASYHTKTYCARQAIECSDYRTAADTARARAFSLMCDINGSSQSWPLWRHTSIPLSLCGFNYDEHITSN